MKSITITLFALFVFQNAFAQFPKKALMKKLKADSISMDNGNGDGVFTARNRKTKKWGMYQWMYEGTKTQELIPMKYDSLQPFPFNGNYTVVYNKGKVGFYLAYWSYQEKAKESIPCIYDDYQRYSVAGVSKLAVKKNGKWAWIDWLTGEEKSAFEYDSAKDLPYPSYEQKTWME